MSNSFTDLLREVSGRTSAKKEKAEQGGRAPVVSQKPRKATANVISLFKTMCRNHFKIAEKIRSLKKEDSAIKDRVTSVCDRHGVTVNTLDKAFYAHPYKAQIEYHRSLGSINAEVIREWHTKSKSDLNLFIKDNEIKLDVTRMQEMLRTNAIKDQKIRTEMEAAMQAVLLLARQHGFVEETDEEYLNIEAWDEAKAKGLVPKKVSKKAEEHMQTSVRISIDKITGDGKDRCPGCSEPIPKRRQMLLYSCKRCGTES